MNKVTIRAFTLLEVLVVLTIVAILAAILLPAYGKAKLSALRVNDVSNLRQLTAARELYASDFDQREKWLTDQIVSSGYVNKSLVISSLDPTQEGLGNLFFRSAPGFSIPMTDYKNSYPAVGEATSSSYLTKCLAGSQNFGWLLSVADGRKARRGDAMVMITDGKPRVYSGTYLRIGVDGHLMTREAAADASLTSTRMFADSVDDTCKL